MDEDNGPRMDVSVCSGLSEEEPDCLEDLTPEMNREWMLAERGAPSCSVVDGVTEEFFDFEDVLGTGMDMVLLAKEKLSGRMVAVKRISCERNVEVEILRRVNHPSIVRAEKVFKSLDKANLDIVMEFVPGGDLFEYLSRGSRRISEQRARAVVSQISSALAYLHERGIVHFDVKLENVLVEESGTELKVHLCDFGISEFLPMRKRRSTISRDGDSQRDFEYCSWRTVDAKKRSVLGTRGYIAPELVGETSRNSKVGTPVDMYSLGVMIVVMLSGKFPSDESLSNGRLFEDPFWEDIRPDAKHLISSLLAKNPLTRATASDVLKHKWLSDPRPAEEDVLAPRLRSLCIPMRSSLSSNDIVGSFEHKRRSSPICKRSGLEAQIDLWHPTSTNTLSTIFKRKLTDCDLVSQ
uniref:Protein kinase domain-containing protein n=1 Tax=Rhodosorus marinus TaxID=101924 RepID=A0A7S0BC04_9RHOD|mmetsp:Transcript_10073/g.14536  ORF Transcript_10073/g.14536 Transcript_10073/m.14536 type:complete len:409 (+) Transcript_10073:442-1668(+)